MKCENCGKNEVTFVYQSNINGKVEEKHLCSECAEKLGYTQKIAAHSQRMMQNFFGEDSIFGNGFFDDFFTPMPSLMGRMNRMLEDPFDDFFTDMPALGAAPAQQEEQKKEENLVDEAQQSYFAYMRQMNALKAEMKKAVHQENFERAAQLRDQIHQLEAEHKEQKESK
jgi:protein arginine kinase activator